MTQTDQRKQGHIGQFFAALSQKRNDALRALLLAAKPSVLKPTFTFSKLLAYLYAGLIHLSSLLILIGGISLILTNLHAPLLVIIGLILIALAWAVRPRFGKFPDSEILDSSEAPTLYRLADEIASALGTEGVDGIRLFDNYNASFGRLGLRRRRLLTIGKPLWDVLTAQEHVALIAHELAHSVNGDSSRGFFIGTACMTLVTWFTLFLPGPRLNRYQRGSVAVAEGLANLVMRIGAIIVRTLAYGLLYLLSHDSRRAEYLADYLGSMISGTEAMLAVLGKLYFSLPFSVLVRRSYGESRQAAQQEYTKFVERINSLPLDEIEKINHPTPGSLAQLALDHPPIGYRIEFLKANPITQPRVTLSASDNTSIQSEIEAATKKRTKRLASVYDDDFEYRPSDTTKAK